MITSIKGDSVNKVFWQLLDASKEWPKGVVRRGAKTTVDSPGPVIIHLTDPRRRVLSVPGRNNSLPAACAETLWVLAGRSDVAWLEYYLPRAKEYSDDGCLARGTLVPLLDGTVRPIEDLVDKESWVYSVNANGTLVPGRATGKFSGRRCIIRIKLDNKKEVLVTADHRFMLLDGTFKAASELTKRDRLCPLYRSGPLPKYESSSIGGRARPGTYSRPTHVWVAEATYGSITGKIIHHDNRNKRDNRPENLNLKYDRSDHAQEHREEFISMVIESNKTLNRWYENETNLASSIDRLQRGFRKWLNEKPEEVSALNKKRSIAAYRKFLTDPKVAARCIKARRKTMLKLNSNPALSKTRIRGRIIKTIKRLIDNGLEPTYSSYDRTRNATAGVPSAINVAKYFGCFEEAIRMATENHRIVSISPAGWADTYDLQVEDYQTFALDAGVVVHNSRWRAGYGPRLRWRTSHDGTNARIDPLALTVQELRERPESRRAVIDLFDEDDYRHYAARDWPCNIVINFLIRQGKLDLIVYCRSNDLLYGASGINWFEFTVLQELVAELAGLPLGEYYHVSNSLHYYAEFEGRFEKMRAAVRVDPYDTEEPLPSFHPSPTDVPFIDYSLGEFFTIECILRKGNAAELDRCSSWLGRQSWGCLYDLLMVVLSYIVARQGLICDAPNDRVVDPHMRRGLQETLDREQRAK